MILVTGATGFIGREVVRRLLMARRPVIALARGRHDATAAERVVAAAGGVPHGAHLEVVEGRIGEARRELQAVLDERAPTNLADWTLKDSREATVLLDAIRGRS